MYSAALAVLWNMRVMTAVLKPVRRHCMTPVHAPSPNVLSLAVVFLIK